MVSSLTFLRMGQLRNETSAIRTKFKKLASRVVDRAYGLHPEPSVYTESTNRTAQAAAKERYVKERVRQLIDPASSYYIAAKISVRTFYLIFNGGLHLKSFQRIKSFFLHTQQSARWSRCLFSVRKTTRTPWPLRTWTLLIPSRCH